MNDKRKDVVASEANNEWYDLFSRGARDWLRHNEKVREAVRDNLPEIISNADVGGTHGDRTVRVPVRFLEHYRFQLNRDENEEGAGQGEAQPGDVAQNPKPQKGSGKGEGGSEEGGIEFEVELKIDDIVDWIWEELQLPNLKRKEGKLKQEDYQQEGWSRRGVRSRLDRRRSVKEAIKRRSIQEDGPPFSDEDLRYRQLVERKRPSTEAVVFFSLDVSASMTEGDRRKAKTFFFWTMQGLRRQYQDVIPVFIAHTASAVEITEDEFFRARGSGGTVVSSAFEKTLEIINDRYDPGRYNIYFFSASDGQNHPNDDEKAQRLLYELAAIANFSGYVEVVGVKGAQPSESIAEMFRSVRDSGIPADVYALSDNSSIFDAIRRFFAHQENEEVA